MNSVFRAVAVSALVAAATLVINADTTPSSQASEVQLQLGNLLYSEGRYLDALDAYKNALRTAPPDNTRGARIGVISSALRVAEFDLARHEAEKLVKADPTGPDAMSLYGDALWASGLFDEAETRYRDALAKVPDLARGHHGMARSMAARSRLGDAMNEAQAALKLSPRDLEIHHTVGTIFERMHKYEEAAAAYSNYVNLLPNKDHSEKADWSRAEIRFLRSFGQKVPFETEPGSDDRLYTMDFRLLNEKVVVRAKVNDASAQDFVVDTGSENTVITRTTAQHLGIQPITYTLSAGVGRIGLRGLQLARIDSLEIGSVQVRNIPCLVNKPQTGRRIALKVYGTSGWDDDAFLMPGVDLAFEQIQYRNFPVVVLNLDAPSALLGFQLGGIVGHKFLSKYRVAIDLERSVLRLKNVS